MTISSAAIQINIGAKLAPDLPNLGGPLKVSQDLSERITDATGVISARIAFSASEQTAAFNSGTGAFTLSASGTAQVETATVTAASGATSSGNLALTLTSAKVPGSPLAISVPLTTAAHTSAALIAAAIRAKLAATAAVANVFEIGGTGATVTLTSILAYANDGTLNLAIAAGLGITAAASSTNTTAGVLGVLVHRPGGNGLDAFGEPWVSGNMYAVTLHAVTGAAAASGLTVLLYEGSRGAWAGASNEGTSTTTITCESAGLIDFIALSK